MSLSHISSRRGQYQYVVIQVFHFHAHGFRALICRKEFGPCPYQKLHLIKDKERPRVKRKARWSESRERDNQHAMRWGPGRGLNDWGLDVKEIWGYWIPKFNFRFRVNSQKESTECVVWNVNIVSMNWAINASTYVTLAIKLSAP